MRNTILKDLSPRSESTLEWWFLHGRVKGPRCPAARFMLSLFRQRKSGKPGKPAHTLIWSWLDEQTKSHRAGCIIEPSTADLLVSFSSKISGNAGGRHLMESYLETVINQGPPLPVETAATSAIWKGPGLHMSWEGFALDQSSKTVRCNLPGWEGTPALALEASPFSSPIDITYSKEVKSRIGKMNYVCWPRLSLNSLCNDQPLLHGSAWLDHQWGAYDWFFNREGSGAPLGWIWFGINLNSGHDLVVMVHWDTVNGKPIACHATIVKDGVIEERSEDFRVHSVQKWRSPRTWIEYPLKWEVEIPDFGFLAVIAPVTQDQEVPVFGPARAIWEGVAYVQGRLMDLPVEGLARCELYGYGLSQGIDKLAAYFGAKIDGHLKSFLPEKRVPGLQKKMLGTITWEYESSDYNAIVGEPTWELMSRGGKRWRPLFGMLLLEALGKSATPYEDLIALFAEFPHNGSLAIDDIEDNSLLRRNAPCLHRIYGIGQSINLGNLLYFLPFELLSRHTALTAAQRLEIFQIITRQFINAHMGQGMDLRLSQCLQPELLHRSGLDRLELTLLTVYKQKTGSLLQGLAQIVCVLANTDHHLRSICSEFAKGMGVMFQVSDDILNYSQSSHWTKTPCEDIAEGKITFVLLKALRSLNPVESKELAEIISSKDRRTEEAGQQRAGDLVKTSGALESSRHWCERRFETLWHQLNPLMPPSNPKILLKSLCKKLLDRES